MPDYRLYLVGIAGHVERVREIEAVDDAAAIMAATTGQCVDRMELWCGPRLVADWALTTPNSAEPIRAESTPDGHAPDPVRHFKTAT